MHVRGKSSIEKISYKQYQQEYEINHDSSADTIYIHIMIQGKHRFNSLRHEQRDSPILSKDSLSQPAFSQLLLCEVQSDHSEK